MFFFAFLDCSYEHQLNLSLVCVKREKKPVIGKHYMSGSLEQMIMAFPMKPFEKEEIEKGT